MKIINKHSKKYFDILNEFNNNDEGGGWYFEVYNRSFKLLYVYDNKQQKWIPYMLEKWNVGGNDFILSTLFSINQHEASMFRYFWKTLR